jgi:DNA repair protein RadC
MALTDINIYTLKQVRAKRRRYDLEGCRITCPVACFAILEFILDLKSEPVEKFNTIALNAKKEINGIHIICTGSLNHNISEPREVFMAAMMNNAKGIIALHNHRAIPPPARMILC